MSQKTVSEGLAKQIGRMVEDAALKYNGGTAKLELVKGDSEFVPDLFKLFDKSAARRAETLAIMDRPSWKTVQLGTYKSHKDLKNELEKKGFRVSDYAVDILKKVTVATEATEVDLVLVTVADLGFPNGAKRQDIYAKALSMGLELCPAEVGPQLRLQYSDQPRDEWIWIGMEPIADSDGRPDVFYVAHDGDGLWLHGPWCNPDFVWGGDGRWVFVRRK